MPLYDFRCDTCGDFEAWRKLAELDVPLACPTCQAPTRRLFSPPTSINLNSGSFSRAGRASEEPRVVKRKSLEPAQPRNQAATTSRPWMIGHAPERL